jgi:tetratricopeptide (TPR) repeat protein
VRRHRYVEAEQHYTSALLLLPAEDAAARERALAGRGRVRTDLERHHDALHDLRKARALAEARGDEARVAGLLLDEATLLDFCEDRGLSAEAAERAAPLVERLGDPALGARLEAARGRSHWRYERTREAIEALARADQLAAALGDAGTRVEALLMLAPALASEGRLADAERRFADVVALCEQTGDRLHLGAAYINRIVIWIKRQDHEQAARDQRRALSIARELGHADMERYATYNLAELLYYRGAYEEAEPLARRARELQLRLHARPTPDDTLLLARIAGAAGLRGEAVALLGWVREQCPDDLSRPSVRAILRCVELLIQGPAPDEPADWDALLAETRRCALLDELRDAAYHAAARAVAAGRSDEARRRIDEAAAEATDSPLWQGRLAELRARLPPGG